MLEYQKHEQEVANGWDSTPTGSTNLFDIAQAMGYKPEVFNLMIGSMTKDEYDTTYTRSAKVINRMTTRRKKGRTGIDAMKDICLSFPNKDNIARIFRLEGVHVELYQDDQRDINRISDHEPDFIMTKKGVFGTTSKNVKIHFTNKKLTGKFMMDEMKYIKLCKENTVLVLINTNTKQFAVLDLNHMKGVDVTNEYRWGKFLTGLNYTPKRVRQMSEGHMTPIIKSIF